MTNPVLKTNLSPIHDCVESSMGGSGAWLVHCAGRRESLPTIIERCMTLQDTVGWSLHATVQPILQGTALDSA